MIKKIFSVLFVFLMCCSLSTAAFSQTSDVSLEETDLSISNEEPAMIDVTSSSLGSVIPNNELVIDSDYVQTATADSEYLEWLWGAPEEILSGPTPELLDYFLQSSFMGQQVYSCASTPSYNEDMDFSWHAAFRELISREDCMDTLESYAKSIINGSESDALNIAGFEKLLDQPVVQSVISDTTDSVASYPNLQSMYTAPDVVPLAVGNLVGSINNIQYYSAGTISTANNRSVEVCTPHRN